MEQANATEKKGKYLTFRLGNEEYGLQIHKVREIIELMKSTSVPKTPGFVRGVINLRGSVVPIIELRSKFNMPSVADTPETCVIVVEVARGDKQIDLGIVVDAVSEVIDISEKEIEETPSFGVELDTEYILGVAKAAGGVKILLDIDKVLTGAAA